MCPKDMLTYLVTMNISLPNVVVITTSCTCWVHKKWIKGLLTMLVGGFLTAMIEVLLGI